MLFVIPIRDCVIKSGRKVVSHKIKNMTYKRICETRMTTKEQRIDFPDYTAENQERDAEKYNEKQKKDVYIVKVQGTYGAYLPRESLPLSVNSNHGQKFTEFVMETKDFFEKELNIKPRFHCVLNKGIEENIQQQIIIQKLVKEKS